MSNKDNKTTLTAVETAAAVTSAGAGLVVGGPVGALAGTAAAPIVSAGLRTLIEYVAGWRARRAGEAFSLAARLCRLSDDAFALHLQGDERLSELASRVLLAVQDVALPAKRQALAKVLADAGRAQDNVEAACERGLLMARVIAALDGPHIRVMTAMCDRPGLPDRVPGSDPEGARWGYRIGELTTTDPSLGDIAQSVMGELRRLGMVEDATNGIAWLDSSRQYALTALGREVLALIVT
jgi:hypothetical protein